MSVVEMSINVTSEAGFWYNGGMPLFEKMLLLAVIGSSWAITAWVVDWCLGIEKRLNRTRGSKAALFTLAIAGTSAYLVNWCFFLRLGTFPEKDAVSFGAVNVTVLAAYLWQSERTFICALCVGVCAAAVSIVLWTSALFRRGAVASGPRTRTPLRCGILMMCTANILLYAMHRAEQSKSGPFRRGAPRLVKFHDPWPPFASELRYHTNPWCTLLCGVALGDDGEIHSDIPVENLTPRERSVPPAPPHSMPSIVIVVVESLRSDAIVGVRQGQRIMPNVRGLVEDGYFVPNCYAQSTQSDYSDPCIVSSLYPCRRPYTYFYERRAPWPKVLAFDLAKQYGYSTGLFSSQNEAWGNMHVFYDTPSLDVLADSRSDPGKSYIESGAFEAWTVASGTNAGKLDDAVTIEKAIAWMHGRHTSRTPFIVTINLQTSHFPYMVPQGGPGPFEPSTLDFPITLLGYDRTRIETVKNAYCNALHYVDHQVGKLVSFLDDSGMRSETIVAVTGDHGEAFYENGEAGHGGTPYDGMAKVGLVISAPGRLDQRIDDYMTQSIDIVPTLCGIAGMEPSAVFQGVDILSAQRLDPLRRVAYLHCQNPLKSADGIVTGVGWKLMRDNRLETDQLFLLTADPGEKVDLSSRCPEVRSVLRELLGQWRSQQLSYYGQARYFTCFNPPRSPMLKEDAVEWLKVAAAQQAARMKRQVPN